MKIEKLEQILRKEIEDKVSEKCGVLFSGGIDSAVIAKLVSDYADITCYVAGFKGCTDIEDAEKVCKELGWNLVIVEIKGLEEKVKKVSEILNSKDLIDLEVGTVIYACCEACKEKILFSGTGGDELFLGYYRFKDSEDVKKEQMKAIYKLLHIDLKRDIKIGKSFEIQIFAPLSCKKLVDVMKKEKIESNLTANNNKIMLRKLGEKIGLPVFVVKKAKKAAQYGSGIHKKLLKTAQSKNIKIKEYLYSL